MTVSCPADKIARLQSSCRNLMVAKVISVHDAERILGTMESVRPVTPCVPYTTGHCRSNSSRPRPSLGGLRILSICPPRPFLLWLGGSHLRVLLLIPRLPLGSYLPQWRFSLMLVWRWVVATAPVVALSREPGPQMIWLRIQV